MQVRASHPLMRHGPGNDLAPGPLGLPLGLGAVSAAVDDVGGWRRGGDSGKSLQPRSEQRLPYRQAHAPHGLGAGSCLRADLGDGKPGEGVACCPGSRCGNGAWTPREVQGADVGAGGGAVGGRR